MRGEFSRFERVIFAGMRVCGRISPWSSVWGVLLWSCIQNSSSAFDTHFHLHRLAKNRPHVAHTHILHLRSSSPLYKPRGVASRVPPRSFFSRSATTTPPPRLSKARWHCSFRPNASAAHLKRPRSDPHSPSPSRKLAPVTPPHLKVTPSPQPVLSLSRSRRTIPGRAGRSPPCCPRLNPGTSRSCSYRSRPRRPA